MALPTGVTTCVVTAGAPLDFAGQGGTITLTVTPILGGNATNIVWQATGQPLVNFPMTATADATEQAQVVIPHSDQAGFVNGAGDAFSGWSYKAQIVFKGANRQQVAWTKVFQIPSGQTSIDLDLVPDGSITSPTTAPIEPVTSVNGQTGAVTVEGATDASVSQIVTQPLTQAALAAQVGDAGTQVGAALAAGYVKHVSPATFAQGGTDVAGEIAAAFSSGVPEVRLAGLPASYYPVASTVIVPAGKRLIMPPGTQFIPTADVDVFDVREGATLEGAYINLTGYAGFTSAAVLIEGTASFGSANTRTRVHNVDIRAKTGAAAEGVGILLHSGGASGNGVVFVDVDGLRVRGCATAIKLHAETPPAGSTWVNANRFRGVVLYQPKRAIDLLSDSNAENLTNTSQNVIDAHIQCVVGMESLLLDQGSLNVLSLEATDWDNKVGTNVPSMTLSGTWSTRLRTSEPLSRIVDNGLNDHIESLVTGIDTGWDVITSWDTTGAITGDPLPTNCTPRSGMAGAVKIRRVERHVYWAFTGCQWSATANFSIRAGYKPATPQYIAFVGGVGTTKQTVNSLTASIIGTGDASMIAHPTQPIVVTYDSDDPFPSFTA